MAIGDVIVGIDIGSSKVSLVVGKVNSFNQIEMVHAAHKKCNGIKKTKIIDEDEIAKSIAETIDEIEEEINLRINSAYLTIPGKYVTIVQNNVKREIKDKYAGVSLKDVTAALMQVKDIDIPEGQAIIDIVTDKFILEDGRKVDDPVGNLVSSFTLNAQVILGDKSYIRQLYNIFKKIDLDIDGLIPVAIAERNLILDTNELNDNVMIVDMGAGNTEIGVLHGSSFEYTDTIPLGGDNITKDLQMVLGISMEEAEKLKRQYGLAMKSYIDNDNEIVLNTVADGNNKVIKSSELVEIIEARIEEIFTIINKDIMSVGIKSRINNVILTGQGITNISKSDVAGKVTLNIPVKFATGRLLTTVSAADRTAYSLVRYVAARPFAKNVSSSIDSNTDGNIFKKILERVKEFFYS